MRKGFGGLAMLVQEKLKADAFGGQLFVFWGKRGDLNKLIWHDGHMAPSSVQMIDSTIVRAHQHASGAKRGLIRRVLGVREVARRPRSI